MASRRHDVTLRPRASGVRQRVRLREQRRSERKRRMGIMAVLAVFLVVLIFIAFWQPAVRVSKVAVTSQDAGLVPVVDRALAGAYAGIIPHNSIFFLDTSRIRSAVLAARPTLAAVSISRTGFDSISITPDPRTPVARWCGTAATSSPANSVALDSTANPNGSCYLFDGSGFIYEATPVTTASSTTALSAVDSPLVPYIVYAGVTNASSTTPIGATVDHASQLPNVFDFARHVGTFGPGAKVQNIVIRGDEVDFFLASGTRVTYVIGDEQNAYRLLDATRHDISLSDGSLQYVDLRFAGKVYYKKNPPGK